jgi:hypothetical protein
MADFVAKVRGTIVRQPGEHLFMLAGNSTDGSAKISA